jgi:HD-like signal output (HDOD) protein
MGTVWEQVTAETKLVSLPDVYLKLKSVLDSEDYVLADIEQAISHDPALTARLLRMVNSAYFGLAVEISTVSRAINLLGTQQVHDLVLATSVTQTFQKIPEEVMDMQSFWRRSVYCAAASRQLAAACNVLDSDRLFVAGLLSDIGHLVMYQVIPDLSLECITKAKERELPIDIMEHKLLGFDYAMVGAELLHQWNLPMSLSEPVKFHLHASNSIEYPLETAIVHIASLLASAFAANENPEGYLNSMSEVAWQVTGLDSDQCLVIHDAAVAEVGEIIRLIFSETRSYQASA